MRGSLRRPVFVVGSGRSGTTLMRALLSAHPRIAIAPETHFLKRAKDAGLGMRDRPSDPDAFWGEMVRTHRFKDLGVGADRCRSHARGFGDETFRTIFAGMLLAYGERARKPRTGEKTPSHIHHIGTLLDWFPDASIVALRRDPRAVAASRLRSPWVEKRLKPASLRHGLVVGSRIHEVARGARQWADIYHEILPAWTDDPRVTVVAYEALVENPETELRRVCERVGEEFDPVMLTGRSQDTVPIPAHTEQIGDEEWRSWRHEHHARARAPVSTDSLDKWRSQLSVREVSLVEGLCRRGMREGGYEPLTAPLGRSAAAAMARTLMAAERIESLGRSAARTVLSPVRTALS